MAPAPPAHAQAPALDLPSLAVFEATTTPAAARSFSALALDPGELTRQIEESLRASRRFNVFERSKSVMSETIDAEQELALDKSFDQTDRNAAGFGKKNKVQFVVYPMVTSLSFNVRRAPQEEAPGRYRYAASGGASLTTKVLDTTTGQIAYQVTRQMMLPASNSVGKGISGPDEGAVVTGDAWRALSRDAARQVANSVIGTLFPIQVVQAQGQDIFVTRGEGAGVEVGEVYQLFAVGEALIDPVTKEKLGEAESLLGEVQVTRVTPRFSVLRSLAPLAGQPKAGDIARPRPNG